MKTMLTTILLAALFASACVSADDTTNLIPNGNFDDASGARGWSVGPTGAISFAPNYDAEGKPSSGSLRIVETGGVVGAYAQTACLPVASGSSYEFGAKWLSADTGTFDQVNTNTDFSCTSFTTSTCSGDATPLGVPQIVHFDPPGNATFTSYSTAQGVLDGDAVAVQCSASVSSAYNAYGGSSGILLDDAFFNATSLGQSSIALGGYMSGNWYDLSNGGEGFQLEFTAQQNALLAIWFTFSADGSGTPIWIYAQGPYDTASNSVTVPAYYSHGANFPPAFQAGDVSREAWGTFTFTFYDCNHGTASWAPTVFGYSAGSMSIGRLTSIAGTSCPQ